jgi:Nicotinic acid mononucleotide adenylyltransferase
MNNENVNIFDVLKVNEDFNYQDIDMSYEQIDNKSPEVKFAWKVLRDKYYSKVYKKYSDIDKVIAAGFIVDKLELKDMDYYNLDFLTTPTGKILNNFQNKEIRNPIILVTTGGFDPLHDGHLHMMEESKRILESKGFNVVGGYFSPSHDTYVSTKPFNCRNAYERVSSCQDFVKDSEWLMIDPWESMYVKTYINFTDVVNRLELYLKKHVNHDIRVAYVFGGDNAQFMYCFENAGIGVCVERNGYNEIYYKMKDELSDDNMFFIDNKSLEANYSSRDIRKAEYSNLKYEKCNGVYVIRNESILPLINYKNNINEEIIEAAQLEYLEKFIVLLNKVFGNEIEIKIINMMKQLEDSYNKLKNQKTISLDSYYRGTYNIEVSRLFDISDPQKNKLSLIGRIDHDTIANQISLIEKGNYILVDDDSATGSTIRGIKEQLSNDVKIDSVYLLSNVLEEKIFDVVDFRDFIIGSINGGLVVRLPNGDIVRAPYVFPYVSLKSRANIKTNEEMYFSINIWKMNKVFYNMIDRNISLSQTDYGFRKLMNYLGFQDSDLLIDICDWHIKKLEQNT